MYEQRDGRVLNSKRALRIFTGPARASKGSLRAQVEEAKDMIPCMMSNSTIHPYWDSKFDQANRKELFLVVWADVDEIHRCSECTFDFASRSAVTYNTNGMGCGT